MNQDLGKLPADKAELIVQAADEVIEGKLDDQFPLRIWQTGSGTQTNMNVNEVISNRAIEIAGGVMGARSRSIPTTTSTCRSRPTTPFPTAMHIAAAETMQQPLIPAVAAAARCPRQPRRREFEDIVKIGRTHLHGRGAADRRARNFRLGLPCWSGTSSACDRR